jgi:methylated-DNA-[protein]-cysteine S-methyltransferase
MAATFYTVLDCPVGALTLAWADAALIAVSFGDGSKQAERRGWRRDGLRVEEASTQLREYFNGERKVFELPLRFAGTPFQERVWNALRDVPFGTTVSYGELAERIGEPRWPVARYVGTALGQNPLAIVLPCHRVIGADGSLTGFGGGLPRKRWLLDHEGSAAAVPGGDQQTRLPGF